MVRGSAWLGVLLCLGLAACSSPTPSDARVTLKEGLINGGSAPSDQAVLVLLRDDLPVCTGTLIAPNLVVTARSCVADSSTGDEAIDCETSTFGAPYDPATIVLSWASNASESSGGDTVVKKVRVPEGSSICGNDIALLILPSVTDIAPIWPRLDPPPQQGEGFTAVGFGARYVEEVGDGGTPSPTWLRNAATDLTVGCVGPCQGSRATETEWIGNARLCEGDAGGPALDLLKHLIGVASRSGEYCIGGLYTSVSAWMPFIVEAAIDAAEVGGYDAPVWTQALPDGGTPPDPDPRDGGAGAPGESGSGGSSGTVGTPGGGRPSGRGGAGGSAAGATASRGGSTAVGGAAPTGPGAAGDSTAEAGAPTEPVRPTRSADTVRDSGCGCRVADERPRGAEPWPMGVLLLAGRAWRRRRRR